MFDGQHRIVSLSRSHDPVETSDVRGQRFVVFEQAKGVANSGAGAPGAGRTPGALHAVFHIRCARKADDVTTRAVGTHIKPRTIPQSSEDVRGTGVSRTVIALIAVYPDRIAILPVRAGHHRVA